MRLRYTLILSLVVTLTIIQCTYKSPAIKIFDEGVKSQNRGNLEKAKSYFKKAIDSDSNYTAAYIKCGHIYEMLGHSDSAILFYTKALAKEPENVLAYLYRAMSYMGNFRYLHGDTSINVDAESAISDYNKVFEFAPDRKPIYYNRALVYEYIGEKEKALADYKNFILEYEESIEEWHKLFNAAPYPFKYTQRVVIVKEAVARLEKELNQD